MVLDLWTLGASLAVGVAVLGVFWWRRYSKHFARRGVPYVPPLPVVGNMLSVALRKESFYKIIVDLYKKLEPHQYGGIFSFWKPLLMVRDPELIRAITIKDFDHFTDHLFVEVSGKSNPLLQRMLLTLKGKEWHDMRTTLSPAFSSMKMKNMFVLITEIGEQIVDHLTKLTAKFEASSRKEDFLELEMKDFFTRIATDIIATTAFGVRVDSLSEMNNTFYTMGRRLTHVRPLVGLGYTLSPKLMELLGISFFDRDAENFLRSMVSDTVRTREKQGIVRHDMLHLLMEARRGEPVSQEREKSVTNETKTIRLTDDDIVAQAMIFFFAGFDTVSTAMTFCSYLLATHEDVQRRLQQEVDRLMESSGGRPSYEQVMGCQYLDMVVSETLRMYPPLAAMDRKCTRTYQLPATRSCYTVELHPGEAIWVPVIGIHRDPEYYPDPDRFDPERFSPDNKHLLQPFTYFPFGSGPRLCIAQRFALMETKVVLTYLLSKFSLHVIPKTPMTVEIQPDSISITMKGGAWLGIRRRS